MVDLQPLNPCYAQVTASIHQKCFEKPWTKFFFEHLLREQTVCPPFGWLALQNEMPAGFILARHLINETEILTFAVLPVFRKKGVGQTLLRQLIQACQKPIFLEVSIDNQPALNLYRQQGFIIRGERKNYYDNQSGQPGDAYVMECS